MNTLILPTANLTDYTNSNNKKKFIETVGSSLVDLGFFALEGHGIDFKDVRKCYDLCKEFFSLPENIKNKYFIPGGGCQRGFAPYGQEHAKTSLYYDLKEFWHIGPLDSKGIDRFRSVVPQGATQDRAPSLLNIDEHAKQGATQCVHTNETINIYPENLWPSEIKDFKPVFTSFYKKLEEITLEVLKACSEYVGLKDHELASIAVGGNSILRLIHYPPVPDIEKTNHLRAAAHEDINLITLLCSATSDGLELKTRQGEWVAIKSQDETIVIDAADMLQNITNGYFRSTTHRVANPKDGSNEARFSMPFFCHARSDASLAPLPTCIEKTGGVKKYRDIKAGEYLQERLAEIGLAQFSKFGKLKHE